MKFVTNCSRNLENYRTFKYIEDWKQFKRTVKIMKHVFFDLKIQEISNKKRDPWELMNWVNKCKLSAVKTVKYNGCSCLEIKDLWLALYLLFNMAQNHQVNIDVLDEIPSVAATPWVSFLKEEFINSIAKCNNLFTPGPDKLS